MPFLFPHSLYFLLFWTYSTTFTYLPELRFFKLLKVIFHSPIAIFYCFRPSLTSKLCLSFRQVPSSLFHFSSILCSVFSNQSSSTIKLKNHASLQPTFRSKTERRRPKTIKPLLFFTQIPSVFVGGQRGRKKGSKEADMRKGNERKGEMYYK